jgi:hypothetical protein
MSLLKIILSLLFILILKTVFSQKQETEKRVDPTDVPEKAILWVDKLDIQKKHVKWYFEVTSGKHSYESKFINLKKLYSVEFDTLGRVEDIEVLMKKHDLNKEQKERIEESINKGFEKSKLVKIQFQYLPKNSAADLLKWINENDESLVIRRFEIEFEARLDGVWKLYEGTFDEQGNLLDYEEILLRSTENLNY